MICAEAKQLFDGYLDNELDLRSALDVEQHLARCPACGAEQSGLREQQAFVRANLTRFAPPPKLEARLRAALRQQCAKAQRSPSDDRKVRGVRS